MHPHGAGDWVTVALVPGLVLAATLLIAPGARAAAWSDVAINGARLTVPQLRALEQQIGAKVAPGVYLVNASGCWLNVSTGQSGCLGSGDYHSRYGSGERSADRSWNHWSNSADMGVGGTADGCIYTTTGWSNC